MERSGDARDAARPPDGVFDVVVFGPHPDDVEMGIAGTVLLLTDAGKRVLNVSLTRGEMGTFGTPETRAAEFAAACRILGCEGLLLDFPDTRVANDSQGRLKIARLVRTHRPTVVFAPYHSNRFGHLDGSANVDHPATGAVVRDGLKLARFRNVLPELPPHEVTYLLIRQSIARSAGEREALRFPGIAPTGAITTPRRRGYKATRDVWSQEGGSQSRARPPGPRIRGPAVPTKMRFAPRLRRRIRGGS